MKRKCTDRQYHVQDNAAVELKDLEMYCITNQFPELLFSGPHYKLHGARVLSKHYHIHFDPKLGMGVCAIRRIPCACVACKSMLENLGYMLFHQTNKSSINISPSALIGQY